MEINLNLEAQLLTYTGLILTLNTPNTGLFMLTL
jgi:hypothetical protein